MMPHANYVLNERALSTFQSRFASLKVPSEYSASLVKHVLIKRWASMKAHDWHVLMEENTKKTIMWLNRVFDGYVQKGENMIECTKVLSQMTVFHIYLTKYSTPR
jgi:hypothetical protein